MEYIKTQLGPICVVQLELSLKWNISEKWEKQSITSKTSLGQQWCCFIQGKCLTWIAVKKEFYLKGKKRKNKKRRVRQGEIEPLKARKNLQHKYWGASSFLFEWSKGLTLSCVTSPCTYLIYFLLAVKQTSILSSLQTRVYQKRYHIVQYPVLEEIEDVFERASSDLCCLNCSITLLVMK